jgi:3-isopropylmalate dehydrogenase
MSGTTLLVLPGDGIGPEITDATLRVLDAAAAEHGVTFTYERDRIGFEALHAEGTTLPDRVLARARAADGILLGSISHLDYPPRDQGGINVAP